MSLSRLARMTPQAAAIQTPRNSGLAPQATPETPAAAKTDGFDALVKYLPTETITLYVAAMAAFPSEQSSSDWTNPWVLYGAGAVLTPVILLLISLRRFRQSGTAGRFKPAPWPLIASLIAFLVWGLSVPGLPLSPDQKIAAAFGAMFVSALLSLVGGALGLEPQE